MDNQDDALIAEQYDYAVIRLATFQSSPKAAPRLLFGTVSLLAKGRSPNHGMFGVEEKKITKSVAKVYFRRVVMTASDAIKWYRAGGVDGFIKTPRPMEERYLDARDDKSLSCSPFEDNPVWPTLGIPWSESYLSAHYRAENPAPFLGDSASRVHRRFGDNEGFESLIADSDALNFLHRRLHLNLASYPEYLGGLSLIAPDPIIQKIENYLVPAESAEQEKICIRITPRPGKHLDNLQLTFFDKNAGLLTYFESVEVPPNGVIIFSKKAPVTNNGYFIHDKQHGVLAYLPPTTYMRQMNLTVGVSGQQTNTSVPVRDSPSSPSKTYTTTRQEIASTSKFGHALESANTRVNIAASQRQKKIDAERYDQRWFSNKERNEAIDFIHSKIADARKRVIIADPYFGPLQIPQFLPRIENNRVFITVLTSKSAFEETEKAIDESAYIHSATQNEQEILKRKKKIHTTQQKLNRFRSFVEQLKKLGYVNLDSFVLSNTSTLHDRFLVVDDNVWFMGHSLNALGDKPCLILKVPNPDEIIERLLLIINGAKTFDHYGALWEKRASKELNRGNNQ